MATYVQDTFTRTVSNGWGTPDVGAAWTLALGTAANFSTDGSTAGIAYPTAVGTQTQTCSASMPADHEVSFRFSVSALPIGGTVLSILNTRRADANNYYQFETYVNATGVVQAVIEKRVAGSMTTIQNPVSVGLTATPGMWIRVRCQIVGTSLKMRIWQDGTTEPNTWPASTVDSSLASGSILGFGFYDGAASNSIVVSLDDLVASDTLNVSGTTDPGSGADNRIRATQMPYVNGIDTVDTFTRTVANGGWGTPDTGPAWVATGPSPTITDVNGTEARMQYGVGSYLMTLPHSLLNFEMGCVFWLDALPTGATANVMLRGRWNASVLNSQVQITTAGAVSVGNAGSDDSSFASTGITYTPGMKLGIRFRVDGLNPTTVSSKVWNTAGAEPSSWTKVTSATAANVQMTGFNSVHIFGTSMTNTPICSFDNFYLIDSVTALTSQVADPGSATDARSWSGTNIATDPIKNGVIIQDTLSRVAGPGAPLGVPDSGPTWTGASNSTIDGSSAYLPGTGNYTTIARVSSGEFSFRFQLDKVPDNYYYMYAQFARGGGAGATVGAYLPTAKVTAAGRVTVRGYKKTPGYAGINAGSDLADTDVMAFSINTWYRVKLRVSGNNPTTVQEKVWLDGNAEPAGWNLTETDSTAVQSADGQFLFQPTETGTNHPVLRVDDILLVEDTPILAQAPESGTGVDGRNNYINRILASKPLAHLRLNETSGTTAVDATGQGRTGTYVNSPTLGAPGLTPGDTDKAMVLTLASNQSVTVASMPAGGSAGASMMIWAKPSGVIPASNVRTLIDWGFQSNPVGYHWFYKTTTFLVWQYTDGTTYWAASRDCGLSDGVAYNFACTHDYASQTVSFYVNGAFVGLATSQMSHPVVPVPAAASTSIAQYAGNSQHGFDGTLGEATIWGRVLSASEITGLYNAGIADTPAVVPASTLEWAKSVDAGPATDYRSVVMLTPNLEGFWRLNEALGSTTAADELGARPLTYDVSAMAGQPAVSSDSGSSLRAQLSNSSGAVGSYTALDFTGSVSVEAWINIDATPNSEGMIARYSHGNSSYMIGVRSTGALEFVYYDGAWKYVYTSSGLLVQRKRYYVVATRDVSNNVLLYINGVNYASVQANPQTQALSGSIKEFLIGTATTLGVVSFSGLIDDVAVYSRAITAAEVAAHFNAGDKGSLAASPASTLESGSTSDSSSPLAVALSLVESSSGSDTSALAVVLSTVESALGVDLASLSALLNLVDAGSSGDSSALQALFGLTDNATVSEVSALAAALSVAEAISATDSSALTAAILAVEAALTGETSSLIAQFNLVDSGVFTDVVLYRYAIIVAGILAQVLAEAKISAGLAIEDKPSGTLSVESKPKATMVVE